MTINIYPSRRTGSIAERTGESRFARTFHWHTPEGTMTNLGFERVWQV